jgi:non-specific serine/threonine protein kinase/serine/threonine-protein kinase
MSPEQRLGMTHELDARTDVYTLGIVLFELLTGARPPFDPRPSAMIDSLGVAAETVARERATDVALLHHTLRARLDPIVVRAIEENRQYRYPTVAELANDLEACLAQL